MAERHLESAKGTWAGMWNRLDLLSREGITLPRSLGIADVVSPVFPQPETPMTTMRGLEPRPSVVGIFPCHQSCTVPSARRL